MYLEYLIPTFSCLITDAHSTMQAELNFYATERGDMISRKRRKSLIERALVVSRCRQTQGRLSGHNSMSGNKVNSNTGNNADGEGDGDNNCPICLRDFDEDIDDVRRPITCSHSFHKACISDWLLQKDSCPLCRSTILAKAAAVEKTDAGTRRHILWTQSSMWSDDRDPLIGVL